MEIVHFGHACSSPSRGSPHARYGRASGCGSAGDSLDLPGDRQVDVLALPTGAPCLKTAEAVDYLRAVRPRVAVPIHEATLAMPELNYRLFDALAPDGSTVRILPPGQATTV